MKKQTFIPALALLSLAFFSCSKQQIKQDTPAHEATAVAPASSGNTAMEKLTINPLNVGLAGWFTFNSNLKDQTKQLPDGISTTRGVIYTTDRNGNAKSAIKFNGSYGVKLSKVPQQTNVTLAAWVKYDNPNLGTGRMIVKPKTTGIGIGKKQTEVSGSIDSPVFGSLGLPVTLDMNWHHIAVTFDGDYFRVFVDGIQANFIGWNHEIPFILEDYTVGFKNDEWFEGSVDELRFYKRTLSSREIYQLANL